MFFVEFLCGFLMEDLSDDYFAKAQRACVKVIKECKAEGDQCDRDNALYTLIEIRHNEGVVRDEVSD